MGYGQRYDPMSGKKLNLDKIYFEIIKPTAEECGYNCYRGDEIHDSGIIDISMYYGILDADLVIADISTLNPNAIYELGVRHGVRKRKTIVMLEQSNKFFFDLNHVRTITYKYPRFGGIRQSEIDQTKNTLRDTILHIDANEAKDSPLYTYITDLIEPQKQSKESKKDINENSLYVRVKEAISYKNKEDYRKAVESFERLHKEYPTDLFFLQQWALCIYKLKLPTEREAYDAALRMLTPIADTIDPETNGLLGSIYKRLYELNGNVEDLNKSIETLEKAYSLFKGYYNGDNLAYCLNLRASIVEDAEERAELNIMARRIRKEIYENNKGINPNEIDSEDEIWLTSTLANVCFALGKEEAIEYEKMFLSKASRFMQESYIEQKGKLFKLLNIEK